jgi:hypothetical protein
MIKTREYSRLQELIGWAIPEVYTVEPDIDMNQMEAFQ